MPDWTKKFGYGDFIHLDHTGCKTCMMKGSQRFREIKPNCFDEKVRIEEMHQQGVDVQVLSTIPVLFNYWSKPKDGAETARFFNDHLASVVEMHPQHFIALGTVPMQDIDLAIQELERCVLDLGMPGVEIGTNINGVNLNDPKFHPFYEAADELGCSIFVHPWDMMGNDQLTQYWLPWLVGMPAETTRAICSLIFGGIFESFPKIRWCFAHGGGSFAYTLGRIQHGFNVRPDLVAIHNPFPPNQYLNKFWVDSLVHDPAALNLLMEKLSFEKICLGTDYPFPLGELQPGTLINESNLANDIKHSMLWSNALDWLNLSEHKIGH